MARSTTAKNGHEVVSDRENPKPLEYFMNGQ